MKLALNLTVNNDPMEILIEPDWSLLRALRDGLGLFGAKEGCGLGECGACTVIMNGRAINSCLMLALEAEGSEVLTIEGLAGEGGDLHPIQRAFVDHGAIQCGFCTPGMVLAAKALLEANPDPTEMEVRAGIAGNLCRCTGYNQIVEAILAAAQTMQEKKP
ncbi:MAG: (2Fe-2S)-binding protein [Deltaproteobacteria bacterium]|nr:(2Fe-2S)-binding protein [Deltaproteobacteria bacterium]